ncbi:hypothetical protein [Pseudohoeflea coraliihabitans]|uniref:Uncharacterized protein n=1 Tax=Pseudohoeflea coraliihabitans TaxID=2860393 RepID=A0ABS6WM89_9HYPH|nr:hypothetical protein [Pseudohoeflea sp. DP4N28-3]MBW3097051.1 hypothetical protein [Pseudohoeflea sp. DP4N28-3]
MKKVIQRELENFYKSDFWRSFLDEIELKKGVRHAHLSVDSSVHPANLLYLTRAYFKKQNEPLRRSIWLTSEGPGFSNCYYIAPETRCHFEIMQRYNPEVIIEPMPPEEAIGGKNIDIWDDAYMADYYKKFEFRPFDEAAEKEVDDFFESSAWHRLLELMVYNVQRNKHGHLVVRMGVHPEEVAKRGLAALRKRGWVVDRAVDITFRGDVGGALTSENFEYKKITFLLQQPETVLEIEWEYDPSVIIEPRPYDVTRLLTIDNIQKDLGAVAYNRLTESELKEVVARL